ncbi:MAG: 4'-phosphopantetheinyl transferase superfamily protein [Actinomycetota bacterium]|nr:4'-phosphopantetheinyl transferase superfamily protein [Actinomycetota bacterium]
MSRVEGVERLLRNVPKTVCYEVLMAGDQPDDKLMPEEVSAISERAAALRRESFRLGRTAARNALAQLGAGRPAVAVGRHREPLWPKDVVGSITHVGSCAIAAVAWKRDIAGIGIDLEMRRGFEGLRRSVAFGGELGWLAALDAEEAESATIEVFAAKEAIFKAFYPRIGRFFGFDSATLEPAVPRHHYLGRLTEGLVDEYPASRSFRIDVGWHRDLVLATLVLEAD